MIRLAPIQECGSTNNYCGTDCQKGFGTCKTSGPMISPDGTCGGSKVYACLGSSYGNCCSQYGYCGSSKLYCTKGCQSKFGSCSGLPTSSSSSSTSSQPSSSASSPPAASPTLNRCGTCFGYTCQRSQWGNCCSQYSYCGTGCQAGFGKCSSSSSSSFTPSSSSSSSLSSSNFSVYRNIFFGEIRFRVDDFHQHYLLRILSHHEHRQSFEELAGNDIYVPGTVFHDVDNPRANLCCFRR